MALSPDDWNTRAVQIQPIWPVGVYKNKLGFWVSSKVVDDGTGETLLNPTWQSYPFNDEEK